MTRRLPPSARSVPSKRARPTPAGRRPPDTPPCRGGQQHPQWIGPISGAEHHTEHREAAPASPRWSAGRPTGPADPLVWSCSARSAAAIRSSPSARPAPPSTATCSKRLLRRALPRRRPGSLPQRGGMSPPKRAAAAARSRTRQIGAVGPAGRSTAPASAVWGGRPGPQARRQGAAEIATDAARRSTAACWSRPRSHLPTSGNRRRPPRAGSSECAGTAMTRPTGTQRLSRPQPPPEPGP